MAQRLGLISDIHGDLVALEAALQLLTDKGVDKIVCAGDLVEKGPQENEVVALLQDWCIPCVKGNHDENALRHAEALQQTPSLHARSAQGIQGAALWSTTKAVLSSLPTRLEYLWEGQRVLIVHARPDRLTGKLRPDTPPRQFKNAFKHIDVDVIIFGHSHEPMWGYMQRKWYFNPGSVCGSAIRDSHTCAILELPSCEYQVLDIATGQPVRVPFVG